MSDAASPIPLPATLGALRAAGHQPRSVKQQLSNTP